MQRKLTRKPQGIKLERVTRTKLAKVIGTFCIFIFCLLSTSSVSPSQSRDFSISAEFAEARRENARLAVGMTELCERLKALESKVNDHIANQSLGQWPEKISVLQSDMDEIKWTLRAAAGGVIGMLIVGLFKNFQKKT